MTKPHTTIVNTIRAVVVYRAHCVHCGEPIGDETTDRATAEAQARWHRWHHRPGATHE